MLVVRSQSPQIDRGVCFVDVVVSRDGMGCMYVCLPVCMLGWLYSVDDREEGEEKQAFYIYCAAS